VTATLDDIREAIAADLNEISDLRADAYLTPTINPPHAMIDIAGPTQVTFSAAGAVEYTFTVAIFDTFAAERSSQKRFDQLRDPFHARSVKRKIEDSARLAALDGIDYGEVGPGSDTEPIPFDGVTFLRVTWPLQVVIHQES